MTSSVSSKMNQILCCGCAVELSCLLWIHKHAKKILGQYPTILTSRLVNKPYLKIYSVQFPCKFIHVDLQSNDYGISCFKMTAKGGGGGIKPDTEV